MFTYRFAKFFLLAAFLLSFSAANLRAQGLATIFVQPPGSVPIPALADSLGNQYVVLNGASIIANNQYYVSATLVGAVLVAANNKSIIGLAVTPSTVAGYIMIFDAIITPGDGAVTPQFCAQIPLGATTAISLNFPITLGITAVFSTTGCLTKTLSSTVFLSVWYL